MGNETRKDGANDRRCSSSFQGGMFLENCQEKVYLRKLVGLYVFEVCFER